MSALNELNELIMDYFTVSGCSCEVNCYCNTVCFCNTQVRFQKEDIYYYESRVA